MSLPELILDELSDAVILVTLDGAIVRYWNRAAESIYGWTAAEALGRTATELLESRVLGGLTREEIRAALARQGYWRGEVTQRHRDGHELTVEASLRYLHGPDGARTGLLAINRDISATLDARAALHASEAHLRAIFDGTRAAYYLIDREYRVLAFNRVVADAIRNIMDREVAIGDSILEYLMPTNRHRFVAHVDRALHGEISHYERLLSYGPGQNVWHELSFYPVRAADDVITGAVVSGLDITTRKQAEAELRLRDRAIGAASTGILIVDAGQPDLPMIYVNPACERITGYSAAELLGRNCRMLAGPGTDPGARQQLRDALATGRGCNVTLLNYRKDGRPFWNDLQISPVTDEHGHITHYIGVQTDVSERIALEAELRHSQKMDTIGRLAGGIAHDFNNLLTVIGGASGFAHELLPPDHPAQLELAEITVATERAAVMTRHLLTSARKQSINPSVVDLNALIVELQRMLRRLIAENIALDLDLDPALAPVRADAAQLEQVLVNLAVNARDAMPGGGVLKIATRNLHLAAPDPGLPTLQPGDHIVIEVHDDGVGMSPETQAHIFEPFFTTKDPGLGTGLGLPTCYGIVKQHRGHISCESAPGRGARFRIVLPADATTAHARLTSTAADPIRGGTETILLVEDEDRLRALAFRVLANLGYVVITARNGADALAQLAARPDLTIDLLLTDVVMPELGGPELAAQLQTRHLATRVLYISGYHDHSGPRLEPLLPKPFTPADLARRVRTILDA